MNETRWGGAGEVITEDDHDPENNTWIDTITKRGSLYTCSYEEEVEALRLGTKWIKEKCEPGKKILVCRINMHRQTITVHGFAEPKPGND